jgi:hypothetical protein
MIPGSLWRDTDGGYLKYMDWFTDTTQVDSNGQYVVYPKIWILNREGSYAKDSLYTDSTKIDLDSLLTLLLDTLKFTNPNLDSLVAVIIDTIKIDTITASNLGGIGLYKNKVGSDLRFKGLNAGANINIDTTNGNYLKISSNPKIDSLMMPLLDSFFVEMRENISMGDLGNGTMNYHAKFKMMEGGAAVPNMTSASNDVVRISSNNVSSSTGAWGAFGNNAPINITYTHNSMNNSIYLGTYPLFNNNYSRLQPTNNKIELILKFTKPKAINGYKFDAGAPVNNVIKTYYGVNVAVQCTPVQLSGAIYKMGNYPKNFKLLGSNDSTTWVELDNVTNYSTNFIQVDTNGYWWDPSTTYTPTQYATLYCGRADAQFMAGGKAKYTRNGAYTKLQFTSPQNIKKYTWYKFEITQWEGDWVAFDYFQLYEQAGVTVADSKIYETGTTASDTVVSLAAFRGRQEIYAKQLVSEGGQGLKIKANTTNNYSTVYAQQNQDIIYYLPNSIPSTNQYLRANSISDNTITFGWGTDQVGNPGTGEANTASNIGQADDAVGIFKEKIGIDLRFKKLTGHGGIAVQELNDVVYIYAPFLVASATSLGGTSLVGGLVGSDLRFKGLQAGSGISINSSNANYLEISATGGGGGGETNTASNIGSGHGIYKEKVSADLRFKTLVAGSNITIDNSNANQLTISASGGSGGGEVNTITNLGTGYGIYRNKIGTDLKLRSLVAGSNISIDTNANHITISSTGGGSSGGGDVTGSGTVNYYPLWTDNKSLGIGALYENEFHVNIRDTKTLHSENDILLHGDLHLFPRGSNVSGVYLKSIINNNSRDLEIQAQKIFLRTSHIVISEMNNVNYIRDTVAMLSDIRNASIGNLSDDATVNLSSVQLSPNNILNFGNISTNNGSISHGYITVSNVGTVPLTIMGVVIVGQDISMFHKNSYNGLSANQRSIILPGSQRVFAFMFIPSMTGPKSAKAVFIHSAGISEIDFAGTGL